MRVIIARILVILLSIYSALALVVPDKRSYNGQSVDDKYGAGSVVSVPSTSHFSGWSRAPHPKPAPAKPAPAKPAPAKPAPAKPVPAKPVPAKPVPAKPVPSNPSPAQPPKNDGLTLDDNYKVPYPTKAADTCINLNICKEQEETPDEIAARHVRRGSVHLEKRRDDIKAFDGQLLMKSAAYYLPFEMYANPRNNDPKAVYAFANQDVKTNAFPNGNAAPTATVDLVTEHIIELQTMSLFVDYISKTDPTLKTNLIARWRAAVPLNKAKKLNVPWASEIRSATTFSDLVFHALGSKINPKVNALCDKKVNEFKANIWVGADPVEKKKYEKLVTAVLDGKTDSAKIHSVHRNIFGLFDYLNDQPVTSRMQTIIDQVTEVMKSYKTLTGVDINDGSGKAVKLDELFQKFIKAHFKETEAHGDNWMTQSIVYTETEYLKEIKELKAIATKLSRQESQKDVAQKKAYIKQVKDKRQVLEKAAQPIKTKLNTIRTQLEKLEADVLAVERKVAAAATVSAKSKIRKADKWKTIKDALLDKRKELVDQQELLNVHQRKIDLLIGARVAQIYRNLEEDLKVIRGRKQKIATTIKMPALR